MVTESVNGQRLTSDDVTRIFKHVRSRRMQSVDNADQFIWLHDVAKELTEGTLTVRPANEGVYKELVDWAQELVS